MSYISVYVHYVWATKNRIPYLNEEIRDKVFRHIKKNAEEKGFFIDFINGYEDHVHCLVSLNADLSIGKIAQFIKGESSYWINKNNLTPSKFEWSDEYYAVSVGKDKLPVVRNYIANQKEHHRKQTFMEEYQDFKEKYGL